MSFRRTLESLTAKPTDWQSARGVSIPVAFMYFSAMAVHDQSPIRSISGYGGRPPRSTGPNCWRSNKHSEAAGLVSLGRSREVGASLGPNSRDDLRWRFDWGRRLLPVRWAPPSGDHIPGLTRRLPFGGRPGRGRDDVCLRLREPAPVRHSGPEQLCSDCLRALGRRGVLVWHAASIRPAFVDR